MKKLLILVLSLITCAAALGQEFKPYPRANISVAQWQQYIEEVRQKHGSTAQDLDDQQLIVYRDDASSTIYAFTKPGHPAHPAWITRKPEQRSNSVFVGQIGYFAGAEPAFAQLFKEYLALNEKLKDEISRRQSAKEAKGKLQHIAAGSNADRAWSPTDEQKETLEKVVAEYFLFHDKGQLDALYELFTPNMKQMMSRSQFNQLHNSVVGGSGAMNSRELVRVTWYKSVQGYAGVLAAVDYNTNFENFALHCGYIIFAEQDKGRYLVQRAESNKIDKATAQGMSEEQLQNARRAFRC
jgi:Protein of unknown function (DUF4019)